MLEYNQTCSNPKLKTIDELFQLKLSDKDKWESWENIVTSECFTTYNPVDDLDFKLIKRPREMSKIVEGVTKVYPPAYMANQNIVVPTFYTIQLYYKGISYKAYNCIAVRCSKYFTINPYTEGVKSGTDEIVYYYYVNKTLPYAIHTLFDYYTDARDELTDQARKNFMDCVLVFEDNIEKVAFETYVEQNWTTLFSKYSENFLDIELSKELKIFDNYADKKLKYIQAVIMKLALEDYRATLTKDQQQDRGY